MEAFTLSGGLATELERSGYKAETDPLFGGSLLLNNPEAIASVHKRFLDAGADVISTATYQTNIDTLEKYLGLTYDQSWTLLQSSVQVARSAVSQSSSSRLVRVAGSVGPYGASLRDGSEYGGAYRSNVTEQVLKCWHRPRVEALIEAGVDFLAFETIPTMYEGIALVNLLREFPSTRAWISFSCRDGEKTCHNNPFAEATRACLEIDRDRQLLAIGVNCTDPLNIHSLLLKSSQSQTRPHHSQVHYVVYPNSGESWNKITKWSNKVEGRPKIAIYVADWMDLGARYVGGCCRVTPEEISEISDQVKKHVGSLNKNQVGT